MKAGLFRACSGEINQLLLEVGKDVTLLGQEAILAKTRNTGKSAVKDYRRQGLIPAIVYGKDIDSTPISLEPTEVKKILVKGMGHLHRLKVEGAGLDDAVMVQSIDRNPVTGQIVHMDFHKISLTETLKIEIPIVLLGEKQITNQGLILERQLREITVECLPKDIPDEFVVNVAEMEHGETLLAGDLEMPEDVTMVTDPEEVIAVVSVPTIIEEEEEEEEEEFALEGEEESPEDSPEEDEPEIVE